MPSDELLDGVADATGTMNTITDEDTTGAILMNYPPFLFEELSRAKIRNERMEMIEMRDSGLVRSMEALKEVYSAIETLELDEVKHVARVFYKSVFPEGE